MKIINSIQLLPQGTLHSSQVFQYKTKDGQAVFAFSYECELGYYDIIIHQLPNYNGRNDCASVAHWLPSDESPIGKKVCFYAGKEPETLAKAQSISVQYAEMTWIYIKTGVTIDNQIIRNN